MTADRTDDQGAQAEPVPGRMVKLAERFTNSPRFEELFAGGMALIEETAAYLDGQGRQDAKALDSSTSAMYGAESMRLTTRLMQLASWLLLQRAVAEGEMTAEHALTQKKTIKLNRHLARADDSGWQRLPDRFRDLAERANALQRRVSRLDAEIYGPDGGPDGGTDGGTDGVTARKEQQNPVAAQHTLLQSAFDKQFES